MAISNATRLSDFGSGIGTQGAILKVDNTNQRVGVGTTNPSATFQVGRSDCIIMDCTSGVITAVNITASNAITAISFEGSGANLTGVSGFGTAVDNTAGTLGNLVYKTPRSVTVATGTTAYLRSDATCGNILFTRLNQIHVGSGATAQIGTGTTVYMDVLNIF